MCAIIGIASTSSCLDKKYQLISGRDLMKHRGPDDFGEWWSDDNRVGLGHRRLSIIDLSPTGHQPMQDVLKKYTIVFNGEIYNYTKLRNDLLLKGFQFNSFSDTEVILNGYRAWGIDVLNKLNGMFSFCIYDEENKTLFIARDRVGEKPLYYSHKNDFFIFASELKSILNINQENKINYDSFDCFLSMGYVPGEKSIIECINKLPPAHYLEFHLITGSLKIKKYWEPPIYQNTNVNDSELIEELDLLIEASVKKQMVADVPLGILLSGGVDSSIITAMASRTSSKIKTFTVRFPGHSKFDETVHARLISNYFNTQHEELDAADATIEILPILAKQFDEPIIDSSMIPTFLVSQLVKKHCTVALGGDGGDELFGGYGHHSRLLVLQNKSKYLNPLFRKGISRLASNLLPIGYKGRNWLQALEIDTQVGVPQIANYFDKSIRRKILVNNKLTFNSENIWNNRIPKTDIFLERFTKMDFENYLPEDILVKVDRASMLNSLEIRAPFLDYKIIEFAFSKVPARLKTNHIEKKIILKEIAKIILPKEFDFNRKHGFSIPLSDWLKNGPWLKYFEDVLLSSSQNIFNKEIIIKLLKGQKCGFENSERLFALVLFELWRNEYKIIF